MPERKPSFFQWLGRKTLGDLPPIAELTPYAADILQRFVPGGVPPGVTVSEPTQRGKVQVGIETKELAEALPTADKRPDEQELPGYASFSDAKSALPNDNWEVTEQDEFGRWQIGKKAKPRILPTDLTPAEKSAEKIAQAKLEQDQRIMEQQVEQTRRTQERTAETARRTAEFRKGEAQRAEAESQRTAQFREQQLAQQASQAQARLGFEQQQFTWQQQQATVRQEEVERQERARLGANPISWLQYAAYTGEDPVVQPWMMPLMPEQAGFQIGEQIPGFDPEQMQDLPSLKRPSAQLWSRMGPTAQQGFLGFQQAATGARPEETMFRQQAAAPPGGRNLPLRWSR